MVYRQVSLAGLRAPTPQVPIRCVFLVTAVSVSSAMPAPYFSVSIVYGFFFFCDGCFIVMGVLPRQWGAVGNRSSR